MYRLAICEDDELDRKIICEAIEEILSELQVEYHLAEFSGADQMELALKDGERFDLVCLDIYMEGKNGMELARQLREGDEDTGILFITNSQEHLKEGYKVRPLEYLYKPLEKKELVDAIRTDLKYRHRPKTVMMSQGKSMVILHLEEILYIESRNHDAMVYQKDECQKYRISLSELERILPMEQFCRCHNSYLANIDHIKQIDRTGLKLDSGDQIPVGRRYYRDAQRKLIRFHNQKR